MNPWAWLAGFALGWCISAVLGLLVVAGGYEFPPATFVLVILACTPGWPLVEYAPAALGRGVRAAILAKRELWPAAPRNPRAPVITSRWVPTNGGAGYLEVPIERSANWQLWQSASEELYAWYLHNPSLLVEETVGRPWEDRPFADGNARKALLDEWDRLGLASNRNGTPSYLMVTVEELAQRLARGDCDWPEDTAPPRIRPAPALEERVLESAPTRESWAKG